jgi:hypothetical protein
MSSTETHGSTKQDPLYTDEQAKYALAHIRAEVTNRSNKGQLQAECINHNEFEEKMSNRIAEYSSPTLGNQPMVSDKAIQTMVADLCKGIHPTNNSHDVPHDSKTPLGTGGSKPEGRGR